VHGRDAAGPGAGALELAGDAEEGGLVGEAADELDADGEALGGPVERHGHGGLAGDVEDGGEGDELVDAVDAGGEREEELEECAGAELAEGA
jgi:hypothetical protein